MKTFLDNWRSAPRVAPSKQGALPQEERGRIERRVTLLGMGELLDLIETQAGAITIHTARFRSTQDPSYVEEVLRDEAVQAAAIHELHRRAQ